MIVQRFFARVCLFLCLASLVWAQATSQIQGTVQDASGSAVPGASIKATQTENGAVRTTTSGADGGYVLTNLPTGPYRVEVIKTGFSTYSQTGIVLQVSSNPTVDIAMKIGQVSEQVQVEANAALVETQSTGIGSVIENQRILELPLNGRQVTDLIQLAGAAVPQGVNSSRSMQGGQAISVAGGQSFGVAYFLDGGIHNNPFDNLNLPLPFPDALQEFKLETSALTAQNGMHSGAAVNAVTKAGTNDVHGDAFEFFRNGNMNARSFFAPRRDTLKRNQFGGVIGAPIIKNKLFVFGGYQGTITRSDPADVQRFIPTAAMMQGDFSACPTALKFPYVNNKLPSNLISPIAKAIDAQIGQFAAQSCGQVRTGAVTQLNEKQLVTRADYQVSDKQTLFGRYMATTYFQATPFNVVPDILNTFQGGRNNLAQSVTLGDTYLISPTLVNSLRLAFNRTAIHRTNGDIPSATSLGINTFSYMPKYLLLSMGGNGFQIGGGTESDANFRTNTLQLSNDVSWVKGSHQVAFGATLSQWRSVGYANVRSPGQFNIDGSYSGSALSDFVAGILSGNNTFVQSAPNTLQAREFYAGFYVQDTWKASKRLTINYGIRYEPWFPQSLTNGAIYSFDMARFNAVTKSSVYKNAPAGFLFPGDNGFVGQSGMNKKPWQFGPRIGLAYDPTGSGKTSIRASFGRAYDYVNGQFFINTANAPPWGSEVRINGLTPKSAGSFVPGVDFTSFSTPFLGSGQPNIFPVTFDVNAAFSLNGPFIALPPDLKTTAVNNWNLAVQHQFGKDWLVSASYIGSNTSHLWMATALNPITTNACTNLPAANTGCNQKRRLSLGTNPDAKFLGFVDQYTDGGTSNYGGLLVSAQKRMSQNFSLNANWAWSHCVGDLSVGGGNQNVGQTIQDENNRRADRGNCVSDRRHIVNFTLVAQSPKFSNTLARRLGTGWTGSFVYRAASGSPLTVTTNTDRQISGITGPGGIGQRVNYIGGNPYGNGTPQGILNPAAFALPGFGTIGNLGSYNLVGPKFFQADLSIVRAFNLTERYKFEVRAEAFNLTNSMRPGTGSTNPGATGQALAGVVINRSLPTFGTINSTLDPRIMQLAMKFTF